MKAQVILDRDNKVTNTGTRIAIRITEKFPHPRARRLKHYVQMESYLIAEDGVKEISKTEESWLSHDLAVDGFYREIGKLVVDGFSVVQNTVLENGS
jgi:hypothetical protein